MKKRYIILAGILAAAAFASGCGKEKEDTSKQEPQVTVAPAEVTDKDTNDNDLVNMQKSTDEDIKNVIGTKTATASKVILINQTGADVARIYIRPNTDDDDWGDELVDGKFTLKNGDKALYYFDKNQKDEDGKTVTSYDIRITYTDEDRSECFFRKIPLQNITQITLRMDGTGEDAIPYATYLSGSTKKETSTLNEVKQRLGLLDSDNEDDDDQDNNNQNTDATPTPQPSAPTATPAPNNGSDTNPEDPDASEAEKYIGQSLDSLISAIGEPEGSDYENEPETGETGYHYYPSFTVSTTVDEAGNEVVAGVW
ncbi:MAG: hypothetical protein PUK34_07625 [Clostridia bacterium]|nr:hypothetical protein [Clostridia bacterium]